MRYFFYIGGNDSAQTANIVNHIAQREKYDLQVVHVPKTIDNDLLVTDHCPGFGSAAKFVASAFIGDNLDNRALPGVKINVLMGARPVSLPLRASSPVAAKTTARI